MVNSRAAKLRNAATHSMAVDARERLREGVQAEALRLDAVPEGVVLA